MSFNLKMIRCISTWTSFRDTCGPLLMPANDAGFACRTEKSFQDRIGRAPMGEQKTKPRLHRAAYGVTGLVAGMIAFGPASAFADDLVERARVDDSVQTAAVDPNQTAAIDPNFEDLDFEYGDPAQQLSDRIILIQAALVSRGCYTGSINGVWDKRTQSAALKAIRADALDITAEEPTSDLVEAFLTSEGKDCVASVGRPTEVTARGSWMLLPGEEAKDANGVVVPMPESKPEKDGTSRIRTAKRTTTDAEPPVSPEARAAARATLRKYKKRRDSKLRRRNSASIKRGATKKSYSKSRRRKKVVTRNRAPAAFIRPVGVGRF